MNLDKKSGLDDTTYLKMRFSKLNAYDRNILLMIDEIYLFKRVEASGGQVFGLTDGCEVASTALCLMVKSLSSSYKDMFAINPIKNLRAESQKACFDKVMALLHRVGFNVIGISVDNAPANRKFFNQLSAYGKPLCHNILYRALRMTLINVINFTVILRLTKLFYSYNAYGTG